MKIIKKLIKKTKIIFSKNIPDDIYLKKRFKETIGVELDLDNPKTFNEKLQWLKLYDRNPEYTKMVDKYEVKNYVSNIIGKEYVIPTLGVYNSFDEIDFNKLPNQFVIKCTHDSGGVIVCKEKNKFNKLKAKIKLLIHLNQNFYYIGREWPYKNVKPRIIVEKYIGTNDDLKDYKLMCFNGKVKCSFVCSNRTKETLNVTFFDNNWNVLPFERHYPKDPNLIKKPNRFIDMIKLAEKLSKDIPFVRIDFYEVENKVFFGEMTFFPGDGFEEFTPYEWDIKLGNLIKLPRKEELKK